jgi:hypothetical protein
MLGSWMVVLLDVRAALFLSAGLWPTSLWKLSTRFVVVLLLLAVRLLPT